MRFNHTYLARATNNSQHNLKSVQDAFVHQFEKDPMKPDTNENLTLLGMQRAVYLTRM